MLRASVASTPLRLGLFVITTASFGRLSEGACKVDFSADQWKPRVAYEAAFAGKPNISIPLVGSGFNRTVNIDGFCSDILMNSSSFTCNKNNDKRGEFNAYVTDLVNAPTSAKITFDHVNCPLRGVSIRRNNMSRGALFEAEIRFEFYYCQALAGFPQSPVASASVVMGLRKEPSQVSNLLPWMQEVCLAKVGTTTAPASASMVIRTEYPVVNVGKGECKHADSSSAKFIPAITTEDGCKAECRSSLQVAEATKQKDGFCTGFAFNAAATADKTCIQYTSPVTELGTPDLAWTCYNLTMTKQDYQKTTAAPSAMQAGDALTQTLQLREVFAGAHATMTTAKLIQIQPQRGDDFCFPAAWWFAVQDDSGNPASIPVKESEWAAMMAMVPPALPEAEAVKSTMIIDRVLFKTCNPDMAGWGRSCDMPTPLGVCDNKQIINAIVSGILVPLLGWLTVRCFHKSCGWGRPDSQGPENFPICSFGNIFGLSVVAVLACGLYAGGVAAGMSQILGAAGCLHGMREMIVVAVATCVPSALAMIIGLLYMHNSRETPGTRSEQPTGQGMGGLVPQGHKLMLVEVPAGADVSQGRIANPDVLQTGGSAMASYKAMGGQSRIDIQPQDMTSQFLSAFQSAPAQ